MLSVFRGHHDHTDFKKGNGAFWLPRDNSSLSPTGFDLQTVNDAIRDTKRDINDGNLVLQDVLHIGHMISVYSDSQVPDFRRRLKSIQNDAESYTKQVREDGFASLEDRRDEYLRVLTEASTLGEETRSSIRSTLGSIRSFGGRHPVLSQKGLDGIAQEVGGDFPEQWKQSVSSHPIEVVRDSKESYNQMTNEIGGYQGYMDIRNNRLVIGHPSTAGMGNSLVRDYESVAHHENGKQKETRDDVSAVMAHEFGHRYEYASLSILRATHEFQMSRGIKNKRGYLIVDKHGRYVDHFADAYVGSFYAANADDSLIENTEVFSMGIEGTFYGTQGSFIGLPSPSHRVFDGVIDFHRPDTEHRNLVLGILATVDIDAGKIGEIWDDEKIKSNRGN